MLSRYKYMFKFSVRFDQCGILILRYILMAIALLWLRIQYLLKTENCVAGIGLRIPEISLDFV